MGFRAVLFDWRGTLVTVQSTREWVLDGLSRVGRGGRGDDDVDRLMVGDRALPDGGAVEHGISVLLLPPLLSPAQQRLGRVLDLAFGERS